MPIVLNAIYENFSHFLFYEWHTYFGLVFVRLTDVDKAYVFFLLCCCWKFFMQKTTFRKYDYDILIHLVWCFLGVYFINFLLYLKGKRDWCLWSAGFLSYTKTSKRHFFSFYVNWAKRKYLGYFRFHFWFTQYIIHSRLDAKWTNFC